MLCYLHQVKTEGMVVEKLFKRADLVFQKLPGNIFILVKSPYVKVMDDVEVYDQQAVNRLIKSSDENVLIIENGREAGGNMGYDSFRQEG